MTKVSTWETWANRITSWIFSELHHKSFTARTVAVEMVVVRALAVEVVVEWWSSGDQVAVAVEWRWRSSGGDG